MVSGFLISPNDHDRMSSGLAIEILIWSNVGSGACVLNRLVISFIRSLHSGRQAAPRIRRRGSGGAILANGLWRRRALHRLARRRASYPGPREPRGRSQSLIRQPAEAAAARLPAAPPQGAQRRRTSARLQLDVEPERAHLLDEHVEAFRHARLEGVVASDDRLVDLGAAGDVVRLDGQHLLQRVGGAVGFERPHLHFAEALAAELRLAAQRLLGDEAVGADRARVDLVVDEMVQLQQVLVADRHLAIERLAGAPVEQRDLARAYRSPAAISISTMSASRAPSNTGVATGTPPFILLGDLRRGRRP